MDFTFTPEQRELADAVKAVLTAEVTPDRIRSRWDTPNGQDPGALAALAELGLPGMLVPEALGGLGLGPVDFVLMAQACGEVALPEPLVEQVLVVTPLLVDLLEHGLGTAAVQEVLTTLLDSSQQAAVGHPINPMINFAEQVDWLLLGDGERVHLLPAADAIITPSASVDPSRRIAAVSFEPGDGSCVAPAELGASIWRAALNRGALASAAQLLGIAEAMVAQTIRYTADRQQFGRAIGANQAVKHLLADVAVQIEYAKPAVYRAAYTVQASPLRSDFAVSHAKVSAARAALLATRHCIQAHGAMGYTWECDLQIWVKRAWALAREWGDEGFHKNRIHEWLLKPNALLGPEYTFGRRSILEQASTVGDTQ